MDGEWISRDGRWRVKPLTMDARASGGVRREWRLTDTFGRADFGRGRASVLAPNLYTARAFINGYLAGMYRRPAEPGSARP